MNANKQVPVLAIDGPSGSGKGTISRAVAAKLGWHYLDSGALYRAVGVAAGWADEDMSDHAALMRLAFATRIEFVESTNGEPRVLVDGHLRYSPWIQAEELATARVLEVAPLPPPEQLQPGGWQVYQHWAWRPWQAPAPQ